MSASYEDYLRDYQATLSRIRTFLAGARSRATLTECERLLSDARQSATAMRGLAEVEGNPMRIHEARMFLERDITPLSNEVKRALNEGMARDELFYQAPDIELGPGGRSEMDTLIQTSEDLLRETQSILAETEHIGTTTLHQMGRQREQLLNTRSNLEAVQSIANQAHAILTSMSRKACKSKLFLYCLIGVLISANLYALYLIYLKHHSKEPNGDNGLHSL